MAAKYPSDEAGLVNKLEQKEPSFYLFKHKDLYNLQLPLKGSQRVKFTSFHVSTGYIALGTNAGGIHIFRRSSLRHYRFLNAKVFSQLDSGRIVDVCVIAVRFSRDENFLAAALSSGYVAVWALNFDKRESSQVVRKCDERKGSTVTSLCWHSSTAKLFIGDNKGCVTGLEVSTGKLRIIHTIIKEGPAIVQLDFFDNKLLVSNVKRCLVYHVDNEEIVQIGTKGRDGTYGACFLSCPDSALVYCARPGARLWQADCSGQVLSTQQFKKLLLAPATPIFGNLSGKEKDAGDKATTFIFPELQVLRDHFLLTWSKDMLTIIDPVTGNLVLWNNQFDDIEDVCCQHQEIYVLHTDGHVTRYSLLPPKECAAKLFVIAQWLQCAKVLISCKSQIISRNARDYVPVYVVRRLKEILKEEEHYQTIVQQLTELDKLLEGVSEDGEPRDDNTDILLADDSELTSVASDVISNTDSESLVDSIADAGSEGAPDVTRSSGKKLKRLKNIFQGQLKELSLDSVLLAGAQAAGNIHFAGSIPMPVNVLPTPTWTPRSPAVTPTSPSPGNEKLLEPMTERCGSAGSWDDPDSDADVKKEEMSRDKKKRKKRVHTVDLVSPLQPTDLIKMDKTSLWSKEDLDSHTDTTRSTATPVDSADFASVEKVASTASNATELRPRPVAAKHEVVQKARLFLKRLTPEESEHAAKGAGSRAASTCINAPLEVKSLVIMSRATRKKIRDCRVLYDPEALRSTLLEWIVYLEKANEAVDCVYPKNRDTREYYVTDVGKTLSPSPKADLTRFLSNEDTLSVSSIATMCFKMAIYSSLEVSIDDENAPLTNELFLKCEACERQPKLFSLASVLNTRCLPVLQDRKHGQRCFQLDREKCRFIGANFTLLDYQSLKAGVIANSHDRRNLLKTLLSCLDNFTERDSVDDAIDIGDTKVAVQLMRDKPEHYGRRLLRHVFRLYYLVPRDVARLCADIYPSFHPWEVVLVCLTNSANLFNNCSDFLIYVTHLLQRNGKKRVNSWEIFDDIYHSQDFLTLVFHSSLILDDLSESDVRCQCGWPRRYSHKTSFQYEELMIEITNHFRNSSDQERLKELLRISWNHGYWQGCVQILVMLNLRVDALELVLQLDDVTLMSSPQIWGTLPRTFGEWKHALEFVTNLETTNLPRGGNHIDGIRRDCIHGDDILRDGIHGDCIHGDVLGNVTDVREKDCLVEHQGEMTKMFENISLSNEESTCNERSRQFKHECVEPRQEGIRNPPVYHHSCINGGQSGQRSAPTRPFYLLFLEKVGPRQALEIIKDTGLVQHAGFTRDFYYKCVLACILENQQSALCHDLLGELNQHMWTSKCTAFSPQIYQMKEMEILRGSKEDLFKGKEPLRYNRTLEDGGCNWGTHLPLQGSACGVCPLSLCEKLPGHSRGIVIFPCGHVFHQKCNQDNYCLTCFHGNLKDQFSASLSLLS